MNKETLYQVVRDIYTSKVFNKSALDFRIMIFNEKLKLLFKKYECVAERMRNIEEIFSLIDSYLGDSIVERKKNGEVFTSFGLINEMLDTLPVEVWSNPDLRWLDPANGIGNFPAVIIQRLMVGLKDVIKNDKERYEHIITKQIFVCDISSKNMFLYLNIFDPNMEYKDTMNYFRGSYLSKEFDDLGWGKFDIIIGNPPYQSLTNGPKTKKIDKSFIKNSLEKLNDNGLLLFVSPKNNILFLNGVEVNQEKLNKRYNLLHINVNNVEDHFKDIGTDFCYYLVSNNMNYKETIINNNYSMVLNYRTILPYDMNKIKIDIMSKCLNYNNDWKLKKSRIEKNLNDKGGNKIITKILSDKIEYKWTDLTHQDMFKPKVLFALYGNNYVIDYENKLFSGRSYVPYIITENNYESENLVNVTKLKLFNFLTKCVDTMQYPFEFILKNIKYVNFKKHWTDQEIYEYFHLNQDEIDLIEKTIK